MKNTKLLFGEVFTPVTLVQEMLDAINKDFWENPNITILDPAAGTGQFPLVAFQKLDIGLKDKIPDKRKRQNHILEKILYMVEINPHNVSVINKLFRKESLNLLCTDFLFGTQYQSKALSHTQIQNGHMLQQWRKEMKFDLIMGNLPFQTIKKRHTQFASGSDKLWQYFVDISLKCSKYMGYITFIHPQSWRKVISAENSKSRIYRQMREKQIIYLVMRNHIHSKEVFDVKISFDYYLLQNILATKDSLVTDEKNKTFKTNLYKRPFIPSFAFDLIDTLCNDNIPVKMIYSRSAFGSDNTKVVQKTKSREYIYPLVHVIRRDQATFLYTNEKYKLERGCNMFGIKKVIITKSSGNVLENVIVDDKGEYGMTQNTFAIKIENKKQGDLLKDYLLSKEFQEVIHATKGSSMYIDYNIFKYFKKQFWVHSL